jgi:hypothetical protein
VVAVGNPVGLGGTVTAGIVSARGRNIGSGPYDDFVQIDAPANKGNSGGPTFDMEGNVIGVNTAIFSPSGGSVGIAFDIPSETVKTVVAQLKDGTFRPNHRSARRRSIARRVFLRRDVIERVGIVGALLEIASGVVDADRPEGLDRYVLDPGFLRTISKAIDVAVVTFSPACPLSDAPDEREDAPSAPAASSRIWRPSGVSSRVQ